MEGTEKGDVLVGIPAYILISIYIFVVYLLIMISNLGTVGWGRVLLEGTIE